MMKFQYIIVLMYYALSSNINEALAAGDENMDNLISWIREKGGILNSKITINKTPNKQLSHYGMFAKKHIPSKEILIRIPSSCIFTKGLPKVGENVFVFVPDEDAFHSATITKVNDDLTFNLDYDDEDEDDESEMNLESHYIYKSDGESLECNVARNLKNEMKLGNDSEDFGPYMNYLSSTQNGDIVSRPSDWSDGGKTLLMDVLDNKLPPYNLTTKWDKCKELDDNTNIPPNFKNMYIPISDIINHRTGHFVNTEYEIDINTVTGVTIRASRDIQIGEEIFISYNFCHECQARDIDYGTPLVFRDYGIIESYPQKWFFEKEGLGFEIYKSNNTATADMIVRWIKSGPRDGFKQLKAQLQRLIALQNTEYAQDTCASDPNIPQSEYIMIKAYLSSLITSIQHAMNTTPKLECYDNYDFHQYIDLEIIETPYQVMTFKYNPYKNNDVCLHLGGIGLGRKTDILQQCTKYRPHYHEMFVHYSARFMNDIKRVIWVGGGDSMLLHEIIKYPNLELAVGLEIDQTVTRKSFQYFGTQPHWNNEKVQWWYGDAAKSLLVIPKEWYGTFDLVLVDLSETVLSLSVCDKLDILSALGLLLKPDGILVKNDEYFHKLSTVFNYTLQLEFDISIPVPNLCSQPVIYASHRDFNVKNIYKDHNVDVLWKKHIPSPVNNSTVAVLEPWYNYHKNNIKPDTCTKRKDIEQELERDDKSPGIMMILETEDVNIDLNDVKALTASIESILEGQLNLHVIQSIIYENTPTEGNGDAQIIIVLNSGYIILRTWIKFNYCAFDVHLWGHFDKHESIRKSLIGAVQSDNVSNYRIVAGGMFGIKSWKDDMKERGPRFVQPCMDENNKALSNNDGIKIQNESPVNPSFVDYVLEEMITLAQDKEDDGLKVIVFCGEKGVECESLNTLQKNERVSQILRISQCSNTVTIAHCMDAMYKLMLEFVKVDGGEMHENKHDHQQYKNKHFEVGDKIKAYLGNVGRAYFGTVKYIRENGLIDVLYDNGKHDFDIRNDLIWHLTLKDILEEEMKVDVLVIDPTVSKNMGGVIYTLLKEESKRESISANHTLSIALTPFENLGRGNLFEWLQLNVTDTNDAVVYSQVYFNHGESVLDMSLLSSGDALFLEQLQNKLKDMEDSNAFDFKSNIEKMYRNEVVLETIMGESFSAEDYNTTSSYGQWKSQRALGRQTLFQLEKFSMATRVLQESDDVNVNDSIEAYVHEDDEWYAGTITEVDEEDGSFILYTVNEFFVEDISREFLRKPFYTPLGHVPMSSVDIYNALLVICNSLVPSKEPLQFSGFGDGSLHTFQWNDGSVIVLWDGKNHVDINLFTYDEAKDFHDNFVKMFMKEIPCLSVALHDAQPRGIGNVVNFKKDIESHNDPFWV